MDLFMYKKTASFLTKFYSDRKALITPERSLTKPCLPSHSPIIAPFPRVTPESEGISSTHLQDFLTELASMTELHPHLLSVMKDDKIILETEFYPYRADTWHVSHSLCKSITALAVGLLVDDGVLSVDEKLMDIFPRRAPRQKELTVKTLLNMSANVAFNELGSALEEDWVSCFLSASIKEIPGTKFMYNSMNTYMLSAIIKEKTGEDMMELLQRRLLTPMGITEVFWEKCPRGITKGGWGLYMKQEDLLKIGSLMLSGGLWQGKRLISEQWILEMTKKQIETPEHSNQYGYGYQVWRSVRRGSYQFNGMLGQNLILFPDLHMAIAIYSGSSEFFPNGKLMALIDRYFGDSFHPEVLPMKPNRRAQTALAKYAASLGLPPVRSAAAKRKSLAELFPLSGRHFEASAQNIGILPVMMSLFHGNFSDGIDRIVFRSEGETMFADFIREERIVRIPFALTGTACYFTLTENGEKFEAASLAKMTENEDGVPCLKLSVHFLETSSVRHIKFFFHRTKTVIRFSEDPTGLDMLETYAPIIEDMVSKSKMAVNVLSRFDFGIVEYNIERLFSPEFTVKNDT